MTATPVDLPATAALHVPRPAAPGPVVATSLAVGLAAAAVVPAGPPGAGLVLLAAGTAAALARLAPEQLRGWRLAHAASALVLVGLVAVRDAPWLVAVLVLAALSLASLAVVGGRTWAGLARGAVGVALTAPAGASWLGRGLAAGRARAGLLGGSAGPVLRGAALAAVLVLVFGGLLASGDAVFAAALSRLSPDLPDLDLLPARAVVLVLAAAGTAAAARLLLSPRPEPVVPPPARTLTRAAEWLLPLAALDALLLGWVALQPTALFGDADAVLATTGLTLSEHAREGFFQMVAVVVLSLGVVAAAVRWAPRSARPALALLGVLALAVDASAVHRLGLYADDMGLTRLRVATTATALWLAVVVLLVLAAGAWPRVARALPHLVVLSATAGLVALAVTDPDARIAASQVDRGADADLAYLATLSADAVPALDRLPEPARSCVLSDLLPDDVLDGGGSWVGAHLSRSRAADLLDRRPARPVDCAALTGYSSPGRR